VCEAIKSNPRTAHLPVVLLTGAAIADEKRQGTRADAILEKPTAPATLKAVISRLLALASPSPATPPS
jgi:CheY-like chemotaxis protein